MMRRLLFAAGMAGMYVASAQESQHVPPDPPQHLMHEMSYKEMVRVMEMDDRSLFGRIVIDQAEWQSGDDVVAWDAHAWYGGDYDKLWFRTEGDRTDETLDARAEVFWDHVATRWWNTQLGVRHDFGDGPSRTWAAAGVQGLAPYWYHIEATVYVGEESRTAARVRIEKDFRLTQRAILQPEFEANLYGKTDVERGVGKGLSDAELALRLRYEFRREFAPYLGISLTTHFGEAADLTRASGADPTELSVVAGLRIWF